MKHQDHFDTRRNFLCRSACASLGVTSIVNTLAHLRLLQSAAAQGAPGDYRAIVCLFLYGGNDSNNMLVPRAGAARANYDNARPASIPFHLNANPFHATNNPNGVHPLTLASGGPSQATANNSFGLHPAMANSKNLFNNQDLAFVANAGTLVVPLPDRDTYFSSAYAKPPQLFSHSDQQLQWQSSLPDRPFQNGWGGRAADLIHGLANGGSQVSMNISIAGQNSFQVGSQTVQYAVSTSGVTPLSGFSNSNGPYGAAAANGANPYVSTPPAYSTASAGRILEGADMLAKLARMQLGEPDSRYQHLLENSYNEVMRRARDNEALVGEIFNGDTSVIDTAFNTAFNNATLPAIASQLHTVARLMQGRASIGDPKRQIFFVSMGGYDTHRSQLADHPTLLGDLDKSLQGFRDALTSLGLWNDTLLFTNSDFTRTFQPNGESGLSGTDHGWGGHQIVMGGPVRGGRVFGAFPSLARANNDPATSLDADTEGRARGRWIPTTSVEQFMSVAAKWFLSQDGGGYLGGLTNDDIAAIFPNLGRFQNVGDIPANLQFLDFTT